MTVLLSRKPGAVGVEARVRSYGKRGENKRKEERHTETASIKSAELFSPGLRAGNEAGTSLIGVTQVHLYFSPCFSG